MNIHYQYPYAFWLLSAIPLFILLFLLYKIWRKKKIRQAGDARLVKALLANHSSSKALVKFFLLLLSFAAGCITLSNPRRPDQSSVETRKGIDLVIALDVSNSMLATDIAPDRMSRARQFISRLIDQLQGDRIGLIFFAGNAYIQMPLTFDRSAAQLYVSTAGPGMVSAQGTSISDALKKSGIAFGEGTERFRSIVLITDGETHDENALEEAKALAGRGVMINTIGIGSAAGATIPDTVANSTRRDEGGAVVVSKLNEGLLKELSSATNGIYVHLQTADAAVQQVLAQYQGIEKKALGDISTYTYESFYIPFLLPMLLLLLVELAISDRKKAVT